MSNDRFYHRSMILIVDIVFCMLANLLMDGWYTYKCSDAGRRSVAEPEAELVVVRARARQTWGRAPLLRLLPAAAARAHYRLAYGDPDGLFLLNKRDGAWALRLRKHLSSDAVLERQLELEARFVPVPAIGRRARRSADVPAPLRLYVSIRIAPGR